VEVRACTRAFGRIDRPLDDFNRFADVSMTAMIRFRQQTRRVADESRDSRAAFRAAFRGITTTTTSTTTSVTLERSAAFDKSVFIGRARIAVSERDSDRSRWRTNFRLIRNLAN